MGKLIYCKGKIGNQGFEFKTSRVKVYSIEEVCYYIKENLSMVSPDDFGPDFTAWIREELEIEELSKQLEGIHQQGNQLPDLVATICCSCDYYSQQEIDKIVEGLQEREKLPARKRWKFLADSYLQCNNLVGSLQTYEKILTLPDMAQAEIGEFGQIYHNMGVVLAKMGDYEKAASHYLTAYEKNHKTETLYQYFFCLRLGELDQEYDYAMIRMKISEQQRGEIEERYKAAVVKSLSSQDYKNIQRMKEYQEEGKVDQYYRKIRAQIKKWKEEYRQEMNG